MVRLCSSNFSVTRSLISEEMRTENFFAKILGEPRRLLGPYTKMNFWEDIGDHYQIVPGKFHPDRTSGLGGDANRKLCLEKRKKERIIIIITRSMANSLFSQRI